MQLPRLGMNSPSAAFLVWLLRIDELLCISHHQVIIQGSVNNSVNQRTQPARPKRAPWTPCCSVGFSHTLSSFAAIFSPAALMIPDTGAVMEKNGYQKGQAVDVTSPCSPSLTVGGSSYQETSIATRERNCKFPKFSLKLHQKGIYWCKGNHVWLASIFKLLSE